MFQFLERHLEKKIRIAEALYIYGEDLPKNTIKTDLSISSTTFNHYLSEVRQLFCHFSSDSLKYNSDSLLQVTLHFMGESVKSQLLYELFLYPGRDSKFYKERLSLSDATFARLIAQLKENLKPFDTYIVITNGYRIRGDNEAYVGILFTHLLTFFRWDSQLLYDEVRSAVGNHVMDDIFCLDFTNYVFTKDDFESRFFHTACAIGILRQSQRECANQGINYQSCQVTKDKIETYFKKVYSEALAEVEHAETFSYEGFFFPNVIPANRERLKQLIVLTTFQIKLFPYDMGQVPLRTSFFVKKMFHTNPSQALSIQTVLYRAKDYYRVDFQLRLSTVVYFLVTENLIHFERLQSLMVYVHSSLGENHQRYLINQLSQIQGFFHSQIDFQFYTDNHEEINHNKYCFLLTTEKISNISSNNQFLISDFVSVADFVRIILWLREKSSYMYI